ncbi:hypothetical protein LZ30DRAFT_229109 [Colletotrichum cereale]|nr:hypothetical protein LZ30DRAFT_229109 [Colletotrichum cereale]
MNHSKGRIKRIALHHHDPSLGDRVIWLPTRRFVGWQLPKFRPGPIDLLGLSMWAQGQTASAHMHATRHPQTSASYAFASCAANSMRCGARVSQPTARRITLWLIQKPRNTSTYPLQKQKAPVSATIVVFTCLSSTLDGITLRGISNVGLHRPEHLLTSWDCAEPRRITCLITPAWINLV